MKNTKLNKVLKTIAIAALTVLVGEGAYYVIYGTIEWVKSKKKV